MAEKRIPEEGRRASRGGPGPSRERTGHYEQAGEQTRLQARQQFLDTSRVVAPKVLEDLAGAPYAALQALSHYGAWSGAEFAAWRQQEASAPERRCSLPELRTWARGYWIDVPWVRDAALTTMRHWQARHISTGYEPAADPGRNWASLGAAWHTAVSDEQVRLTPDLPGWDRDRYSLGQWKTAMYAAFDLQVEAYIIECLRSEAMASRTPGPQHRAGHHYEWFCRYQLLKESAIAIQRSLHGTPDGVEEADSATVRKALASLAELLDLPLRPPRLGRPKKAGD